MANYWPTKPDNWPFAAVYATSPSYGVLRVSWRLASDLRDPTPWRFSAELNDNANEPSGWYAAVPPRVNVYNLDVPLTPALGKTTTTHLRIKLDTATNTYYTKERSLSGLLTDKLVLCAQAIARRMALERTGMPRVRGWLLKRRIVGPLCNCRDPLADVSVNSSCLMCYGTGVIGGYWQATDGALLMAADPQVRGTLESGFTLQAVRAGILVGVPDVAIADVWVDSTRNDRYVIRASTPQELFGLQISSTVEMELIHPSDIIYSFPIT